MTESTTETTTQIEETTATNVIDIPALHNKNFENYIREYAKANDLAMTGQVWKSALAAAKRLDFRGDRDANPNTQLIASQPSFFSRVFGLFRRTPQIHLTELDEIRAFLELAPEAAAQQSQIIWGPLRNGFGTWVIAILRPGGQQKGSRPTPPIGRGRGGEWARGRVSEWRSVAPSPPRPLAPSPLGPITPIGSTGIW